MQVVEDQIVQVAVDNDEMLDAVNEARASIREFFKAFANPQPNHTDFHLKARFQDGDSCEHIWLSDLDFKTQPATGVVSNEPRIGSAGSMERVRFLPDQVSDWMYRKDGVLVGGFTTRVQLRAKARRGGVLDLFDREFAM
jgi:uncharacterized protein YegJ (DUF2314 family)